MTLVFTMRGLALVAPLKWVALIAFAVVLMPSGYSLASVCVEYVECWRRDRKRERRRS